MNPKPPTYNGPTSGKSTQQEWASVRDYDAYCYVKDGVWVYSDFDNYLYSMIGVQADKLLEEIKNLKRENHLLKEELHRRNPLDFPEETL